MPIDRHIIDEINEKTDIVALVSPYVNLVKKGKNYMGQCPFHDDKSPSFSVSPEKHLAKCMACGEGGSPITFYQKIKNVSFPEAVKALATPLGIKVDVEIVENPTLKEHELMQEAANFYMYYLNNSAYGKTALSYLEKRGLTSDDLKHFSIGLAPKEKDALFQILKNKGFDPTMMMDLGLVKQREDGSYYDLMIKRITFPIHDTHGRVVGFSGRALEDDPVKYLNTPETKIFKKGEVLYHLFQASKDIRMQKRVILYEGFFDVIASYKSGLGNAVATMGTALTKKHAELLKQVTSDVIIAYDGDKAGQSATMKAIPILEEVRLRCDIVSLKDGLDPDDFLKKYGVPAYQAAFKETIDPLVFSYDYHKKGLDLNNSNDIQEFKSRIKKMLKFKDQSIREIYYRKLAKDIGSSYDSVMPKDTQFGTPDQKPVLPKPKPVTNKSLKKYYGAEIQLFIAMTQDYDQALRIEQALGTQFVADMDLFKLRGSLMLGYYPNHAVFDIDTFKDILNPDLLEAFETKVLSSLTWKIAPIYKEEAVTELLSVMQTITIEKGMIQLRENILNEPEAFTKANYAEQFKQLKNSKLKGKVNS
ncbi:DNA primase [Paracholeplasma manati]|uniref:DNA primase n=1 Tax=Paracholeplasma manati TaxID=591373 RepID=UPI002407B7FA|nr:DNA primase [Paracholeplasma manati]MDG0887766.1 DNA primase [Paracholeplasma manati]